MADTDMNDDIITRIVPQDGWSPIICRRVPIQQTITNIVGDKGANEIWQGGSIKNFHAKIDWQDQYSGSRIPADIITESSDDYGETWTMNEVEEHEEGSFELDYEGHERDFEVKLNGTDLYIRYRWLMNGQEITDADGSLEHTITVTDYPVKLVIDAHYEDNYGTHEIGDYTFNSAKVTMKSGAVKDVDEDDLTTPASTVKWADKDGWQSQTWSYTEKGRTVTAQVGARITALRDVKIEASLGEDSLFKFFDAYTDEDDTYYFYLIATPPSRFIHPDKEDYDIPTAKYRLTGETTGDQLRFAMLGDDRYENLGLKGKWFTYASTSNELDDKTAYWTDLNGDDEDMVGSNLSSSIFKEGTVVTKDDLTVTMTRNDGSTYEATDYWMPNNYALGRNKQSVTVQKGSLSTTLPVTVAYSTKVEVGNEVSDKFVKSSFYEYGGYVEPDHYKAYYECYDGTEGFDEVAEIDGEWEGRVEEETLGEYGSEVGTLTLGKKSYLYRVGLEPIDEENYLFIKDFKDTPFNYGLVNCYEPQWEEPVVVTSPYSIKLSELYKIDEGDGSEYGWMVDIKNKALEGAMDINGGIYFLAVNNGKDVGLYVLDDENFPNTAQILMSYVEDFGEEAYFVYGYEDNLANAYIIKDNGTHELVMDYISGNSED